MRPLLPRHSQARTLWSRKKFRSLGSHRTVAVLVSPRENLVALPPFSRATRAIDAWQQRCLHNPPLLSRHTKNTLRRTGRGNLTRITHEPYSDPSWETVYTVRGRCLLIFAKIRISSTKVASPIHKHRSSPTLDSATTAHQIWPYRSLQRQTSDTVEHVKSESKEHGEYGSRW